MQHTRPHILLPLIFFLLIAPVTFLMTAGVHSEQYSLVGMGLRKLLAWIPQRSFWPAPPFPRTAHSMEFVQVENRFVIREDAPFAAWFQSPRPNNRHTVQLLDVSRDETGLWIPVVRISEWQIADSSPLLKASERVALRSAYVNYLVPRDPLVAEHAATLRMRDLYHTSIMWDNVMLNAVSLCAFSGVIASVVLIVQRSRHLLRVRGNLCPHCRYDHSGLVKDAPCPECGKTTNTAA